MADLVAYLGVSLQLAIMGAALVAVRRRNVAAAVNAIAVFTLAVLPLLLDVVFADGTLGATGRTWELTVWIGVAGLLHSFGMFGPYDSIWWWDHLTHATSATLLAALVYGALLVSPPSWVGLDRPPMAIPLATVGLTFAGGIFWELLELLAREVGERYDLAQMLVHYGWRDTAWDLVFDLAGVLIVLLLDVRVFVPIAAVSPDGTALVISLVTVILSAGSVVLGVLVGVSILSRS